MASELKVLSSTVLKTSFDEFSPQFERASGHKIAASFAASAQIFRRVAEGETSDVTIVTADGIEDLIKQGKVVAGKQAVVAQSAIGVAVQKGAPKPDISSAEKFKQALLAAKSVAMSNPVGGGQSGAILAKIFERLGFTEAMKPKTIYGPGGPAGLIGLFLLRGEAELGIQQIPELMAVPGIDIIGPLPRELQVMTVFSAGVSTSAQNADGARALIKFLTSPAATAVMKAKGMEAG